MKKYIILIVSGAILLAPLSVAEAHTLKKYRAERVLERELKEEYGYDWSFITNCRRRLTRHRRSCSYIAINSYYGIMCRPKRARVTLYRYGAEAKIISYCYG